MNPLTQLIAGTDMSSSSLHAVERGFLIAHETGARYTILHALGLDALSQLRDLIGDATGLVSQKVSEHQHGILSEIASTLSRNRSVAAKIQLEDGLPGEALPGHAAAIDADLILIGAHGKGFMQRILLGSTASRLLRKSSCPVLVVKEACRGPYREVLIAVDFSPASEKAIRIAKALAPDAGMILLHVFNVPFEGMLHYAGVSEELVHRYRIEAREKALARIHQVAQAAGLAPSDYTASVLHGDATRQILMQEEFYDCDLLVMGKHGTHVTEELLLGSVTKRVLAESRSDVLVVVDKRGPSVVAVP